MPQLVGDQPAIAQLAAANAANAATAEESMFCPAGGFSLKRYAKSGLLAYHVMLLAKYYCMIGYPIVYYIVHDNRLLYSSCECPCWYTTGVNDLMVSDASCHGGQLRDQGWDKSYGDGYSGPAGYNATLCLSWMQAHDGAMTTEPVIWAWLPLFCWVVIVILELTAYYKIMRMRPGAIWKQLIFPVGFDHDAEDFKQWREYAKCEVTWTQDLGVAIFGAAHIIISGVEYVEDPDPMMPTCKERIRFDSLFFALVSLFKLVHFIHHVSQEPRFGHLAVERACCCCHPDLCFGYCPTCGGDAPQRPTSRQKGPAVKYPTARRVGPGVGPTITLPP